MVDSTAAKSIASRVGLGRVRHIEGKYLWVQEALEKKGFVVRKFLGTLNPADNLAKPKGILDQVAQEVGRRDHRWVVYVE